MFNVSSIIKNNASTFYDFDSLERRSQMPRFITTAIVAIAAATFLTDISDNLLAGFLAVQSILLGFTVNVMFFLLGNRDAREIKPASIEGRLRAKRLRTLYHELFYNVSYFNLVAIASIIVAAMLLLPGFSAPDFVVGWLSSSKTPLLHDVSIIAASVGRFLHVAATFLFFFLAIEVVFSISRVVGRTSFYFERRLAEVRSVDEGSSQ